MTRLDQGLSSLALGGGERETLGTRLEPIWGAVWTRDPFIKMAAKRSLEIDEVEKEILFVETALFKYLKSYMANTPLVVYLVGKKFQQLRRIRPKNTVSLIRLNQINNIAPWKGIYGEGKRYFIASPREMDFTLFSQCSRKLSEITRLLARQNNDRSRFEFRLNDQFESSFPALFWSWRPDIASKCLPIVKCTTINIHSTHSVPKLMISVDSCDYRRWKFPWTLTG